MAKSKPVYGQRNGYVLPDDKLQQREFVFSLYRDMGPARSIHKLCELLKRDHPGMAVTRPSLERWSRTHNWQLRVKAGHRPQREQRAEKRSEKCDKYQTVSRAPVSD